MSESQGKTSKVSTWNGLATKIPQEGYEMEAWNEITAYQRLETAGCNTGLIKIKSMDENKRVIFMEDYTTRGGMTLEECIAGELGINLPDKKDKRVSAIEQLLPNHTFTKDEVRKRAQIVLGLLNATEAYAPHNISENDISNTNVIVYRDGSITLLDFNKAIEVKEKAGKKEFGHLVALDLKRPQDSHYRVVGGILINMYWTHHEMADATKRDQAIYSARMDIDDVMRHHDYHMIMSLVYWSITGNRWTKEAKQGEKIDSTILKDYLQKHNLKEYLKGKCEDKTYGESVGAVLDSMMERAIEPIGTYKKEQIEGDKKTLAGLVSEEKEEYQTIQGGTDKPVIVRKSEKQGMNTLPERSADPLRGELAKMIETHSVYRLRSRELIKERTELQQSSDTLKQKYEDILGKYKHLDIFQECLQMQLAAVKKREIVYGGLLIGGAFIYAVSIPLMCYYFTN